MELVDNIIKNEKYIDLMGKIGKAEKGRRFCLHGLNHSMDVARIAYIMNLEMQLGISKENIYAAALLHDIGRAMEYENKLSHHEQSATVAKEILAEAGFSDKDNEMICLAIKNHKFCEDDTKGLDYVLYKADKLSRDCFNCDVKGECYWPEEIKNKTITL